MALFKHSMVSFIGPPRLGVIRQYTAAVCASISGVLCGCAFVWLTPLLPKLQGPDSDVPMTPGQLSWVVSLIEVGDIFTPIPAALLADRLGRKPVLLMLGPFQLAAWLIILFTRTVAGLYLARFVQGMAMGILYGVLPIYLGEIASPDIRGRIGIFVQYSWHLGLIYEYAIGPFLSYSGIALASLPITIVFMVLFVWFPESPHYLASRGRMEAASKSLSWYRGGAEVAEEMESILDDVEEMRGGSWAGNWAELLCSRKGLRGLGLSLAVTAITELGGMSAITTYASVVFSSGGQVVCTLVIGVLPLIVFPLFGRFMDLTGRRPVLVVTSGLASVAIFLAGLYHLLTPSSIPPWVSDTMVVLYIVFLSGGAEAAYPILQSEMFPAKTRALGSSVMIVLSTLLALAAFQIFFLLITYVNFYSVLFLFAFFCALGAVFVFFCLPETKGKTFNEIQKSL